jgi:hypothetical protein
VAIDARDRLEAHPGQRAAILLAVPEGCLPLPEVDHVERNLVRVRADDQIGGRLEAAVAGAVDEASLEGDLRVALDFEEVSAAQVLVAVLLARHRGCP